MEAWKQIDVRMRDRVTSIFALENRIVALERDAAATTQVLANMDRRLLLARRARDVRQAAVEQVRTADPSLLVLDFGSASFRLADDSKERIAARYGSGELPPRASPPLPAPALESGASLVDAAEVAHAIDAHGLRQSALSIVGTRVVALPPSVDAGRFAMPSLNAGRPGGLGPEGRPAGLPGAPLLGGSGEARPVSSSRVRMLPIRHSPYAILPGGVRVLLPNPNGVGGLMTESFGTGDFKRTALARTLKMLDIDADSFRGGGLIQPLIAAIRPLEQLRATLGSVGFVQKEKRKLPAEIGTYLVKKQETILLKNDFERGGARRLRQGCARRIQRRFRAFRKQRTLMREMDALQKDSLETMLDALRQVGKADAPNCSQASWQETVAAVTIQARFRLVSARIFYLSTRRAQALEKARGLLKLMGVALDSPDSDDYVRAHALASQAAQELALEQKFTQQARRSSRVFDRGVAPILGAQAAREGSSDGGSRSRGKSVALAEGHQHGDAGAQGVLGSAQESEPQRVLRLLGEAIARGTRMDMIKGTPEYEAKKAEEEALGTRKAEFDEWGGAIMDDIAALPAVAASLPAPGDAAGNEIDDGRSQTEQLLRGRKRRKAKEDPLRLVYNELAVLLTLGRSRSPAEPQTGGKSRAEGVSAEAPAYYATFSAAADASSGTSAAATAAAAASAAAVAAAAASEAAAEASTAARGGDPGDAKRKAAIASQRAAAAAKAASLAGIAAAAAENEAARVADEHGPLRPPRMSGEDVAQEGRERRGLDIPGDDLDALADRSVGGSSRSQNYRSVGDRESEASFERGGARQRAAGQSQHSGAASAAFRAAHYRSLVDSFSPVLFGACQRLLEAPDDDDCILAVGDAAQCGYIRDFRRH